MTDQQETKRARVRRLLLTPLITSGLRKHPRMTAEDYQAMLTRLADKLGHMSERHLTALEPLIIRHTRGKDRNIWPDEVTIVSWAYQLSPPPARTSPYVNSLMQSEAGRTALSMGYHVELFMMAKKLGPPPTRYNLARLAQEAQENRRELTRIEEQINCGMASLERRQWLAWYRHNEGECSAIMEPSTEDQKVYAT